MRCDNGIDYDRKALLGQAVRYSRQSERGVCESVIARQNERTVGEADDGVCRQTLIAAEQMKKNGDCIAGRELKDAVTVSVSEGQMDRILEELKYSNIDPMEAV